MVRPSVALALPDPKRPARLRFRPSVPNPPLLRAKGRGRWAAPPEITRGTSIRNSFLEEDGAGETNRAIPDQSVVPVCEALAAPRQRTLTFTLGTPAPRPSAIITAAAARPPRGRAAPASAERGAGGGKLSAP